MAASTLNIEIPEELVILANSTKPDDISLEEWILEWTRFGLEVSQKASSRKEALEIGANIQKAAVLKFAELVDEETVAFGARLTALEDLTDVKDQEAGFGKLFKDLNDFINPKYSGSALLSILQFQK